jgi:hypothetical protein
MPSVGGIKDAMIDYGVGLGGGLLFALSTAFTGSGLIGGLIGAGIAGSVLKGGRGTAVATILGFNTIVSAASSQASPEPAQQEVM